MWLNSKLRWKDNLCKHIDKITQCTRRLSRHGELLHTVQDFYAHTNWVELQQAGLISERLVDDSLERWPIINPQQQLSVDTMESPYSCASPFTIDNSMALSTTIAPMVPNGNSHMLLIGAVDTSGNIDQTPSAFVWTVGSAQEILLQTMMPETSLPPPVKQYAIGSQVSTYESVTSDTPVGDSGN